MMPVHVYAIQLSKDGPEQYVMQRSLDVIGVTGKHQRDCLLKHGYKQIAKYRNGVGYRSYHVRSRDDIDRLLFFLKKEFDVDSDTYPHVIHLSFQEFFTESCEHDWLDVNIVLFSNFSKPQVCRLEGDSAKRVEDFLMFQSIDLEYCVL